MPNLSSNFPFRMIFNRIYQMFSYEMLIKETLLNNFNLFKINDYKKLDFL